MKTKNDIHARRKGDGSMENVRERDDFLIPSPSNPRARKKKDIT